MTNEIQNSKPQLVLKGERCQCPTCGLYFAGERSFDRHRTGDFGVANTRRCKTIPEMLASNMEHTAVGLWRIGRKSAPLAFMGADTADVLTTAVAAVGEPSGATWARPGALLESAL